jgi:hypothetical protein
MKRKGKTQDQKIIVTEQSPLGLRAAARLWIELDRPERHAGSLAQWSVDMQVCYDEFWTWYNGVEEDPATAYQTFKWFLIWACRMGTAGNRYTAEYLRAANNPASTLRRNLPTIRDYWEQFNEKGLLPMMQRLYAEDQRDREKEAVLEDLYRFMDELGADDWRCPNCGWDGDELVKECQDCEEEWMMNHEPLEPTVLELPEDAFGDGSGFGEEEVE